MRLGSFLKNIFLQPKAYVITFFCILYGLLSFVNHYNFRTYGFDLGIYNNILFDYSKFDVNDSPIMQPRFINALSDHLSLYHFVFAPLRYIFGSWTLLLIQLASIIFGGLGIHKIVLFYSKNKNTALIGMVHFFSIWGIYSALSFDYHDNVVASMFVPWLFLSLIQKKWKNTIIWTIIIWISKENMSLWAGFIMLGFFVWKIKDKEVRWVSLILATLSFIYFVLAIKVIMPSMANPGKEYQHFLYRAVGQTLGEIIHNLFLNPKYLFKLLFQDHIGLAYATDIKLELHIMVFVSGGFALLYRPQFLIMLLPIYAQKLFHASFVKWGINYHYSIEFVPILTIALFYAFIKFKQSDRVKNYILLGITLLTFSATIYTMQHRTSKWYNKYANNLLSGAHYQRSFDVKKVYEGLSLIPAEAKVSAQNMIVPHVAFREDIYMYPHVFDSEYIALLPGANESWPMTQEKLEADIERLKSDSIFKVIYDTGDFILFKKVTE